MIDDFPFEKTWRGLSKEQQGEVKRQANKAQLTIPEILGTLVRRHHVQAEFDAVPSYVERYARQVQEGGEVSA